MKTSCSSLKPGDTFSVHRTFTQTDFDRFAALSGDDNPIHVDPEFAARTRFGRTVAHGMFLYSQVRALIGTMMPPSRLVQRAQEMTFRAPTYAGEEIEIRATVTGVEREGVGTTLRTTVTSQKGEVGLEGNAFVAQKGAAPETGIFSLKETMTSEAQTHKGLHIGQKAEKTRVITAADVAAYEELTGDVSGGLVPGGLLGGLFSDLLGTELPGRGTNWLKQKLNFPAFAPVEKPITAAVEVIRLRPEKDLVNLRTVCTCDQRVVCEGEALVYVKDLQFV